MTADIDSKSSEMTTEPSEAPSKRPFVKRFPLTNTQALPLEDCPFGETNLHTPCDLLFSESWDPTTQLSKGTTVKVYAGIDIKIQNVEGSELEDQELKLAFGHLVGDLVVLFIAVEDGVAAPAAIAFIDQSVFQAWLQPSAGIEAVLPNGSDIAVLSFDDFLRNKEQLSLAVKSESLFDKNVLYMRALAEGLGYLGSKKEDSDFDCLFKVCTAFPSKGETESDDSSSGSDNSVADGNNNIEPEDSDTDSELKEPKQRPKRSLSFKSNAPGYSVDKKLEAAQFKAIRGVPLGSTAPLKPKSVKKEKPKPTKKAPATTGKSKAKEKSKTREKSAKEKPLKDKEKEKAAKEKEKIAKDKEKEKIAKEKKTANGGSVAKQQAAAQVSAVPAEVVISSGDYEAAKRARRNEKANLRVENKKSTAMWQLVSIAGNTLNQLNNNANHAARGDLAVVTAGIVKAGSSLLPTPAQGSTSQWQTSPPPPPPVALGPPSYYYHQQAGTPHAGTPQHYWPSPALPRPPSQAFSHQPPACQTPPVSHGYHPAGCTGAMPGPHPSGQGYYWPGVGMHHHTYAGYYQYPMPPPQSPYYYGAGAGYSGYPGPNDSAASVSKVPDSDDSDA